MTNKQQLLYAPENIRTSNMLPDRSADISFDPEEGRTQQQFLKECDINYIVSQNEKTGLLTHVNRGNPQFADLGDATDYKASLDYLNEAQAAFMDLPAQVRARFENNPGQLLDFVSNSDNYEEALSLGLVNKRPEPTPTPEKQPKKAAKQPEGDNPQE